MLRMSNYMMLWRATGLDRQQRTTNTSHPFGIRHRQAPKPGPSRQEQAAFWRALHRDAPIAPHLAFGKRH